MGLNELPPPVGMTTTKDCQEVLRAWVANKGLSVSLNPMAFGGPDTWGLLLVDVARHVSRAMEQEGVANFETSMRAIRKLFDAEWDFPNDMGSTEKHGKH
jgi:hypothetical protein